MKKIALDLAEFVRGSAQFMLVADTGDDWVYPIDLDSTLQDEARFYSPKDENGLPIRRYRSVGAHYNSTRISGFALDHCNNFRLHGEDMNRKTFLKGAPWMPCMAQGEVMTVLSRAAVLTGDQRHVETARAALDPFKHDSVFFEEYPAENPDHVLNGYLYALIEIVSLNRIAPGEDTQKMLEEARQMLEDGLHSWDVGGWSTCDLHNHGLQVTQLCYLGVVLQSPPILHRADIWECSSRSLPKRFSAAVSKIGYRL